MTLMYRLHDNVRDQVRDKKSSEPNSPECQGSQGSKLSCSFSPQSLFKHSTIRFDLGPSENFELFTMKDECDGRGALPQNEEERPHTVVRQLGNP